MQLASPLVNHPSEMRPPLPEQVRELLAAVKVQDRLFHLFLVLAATTGSRRGELLALRWQDIDMKRGAISIQRALVEGPSGVVIQSTKTRRVHCVALDRDTHTLIRERHESLCRQDLVDACAFVFSDDGGQPW